MSQIGQSVPRKEAHSKVNGTARYVDDLSFPEMIHGTTVRSSVARGIIKNISYGAGVPWNEFTIVCAQDIPGENWVALIEKDQPYLAESRVNHHEEPILLLAHPDKYLLEKARTLVKVEIDPLPAIFSIEEALRQKEIIWGQDNIFKSFLIDKGNIDPMWEKAALIVEGTYETGAQEQLYIENQGMIAIANAKDGVTVWGSLQCPYYVHKALIPLFNLKPEQIRVIQAETGGGFGGKEEYPSMIAGHAALLAWKSGKPVKMIYDRAEDMAATTKRHPSRTHIRSAVSKEGKLLAVEIEFLLDGGAYATLSSVVLSRGTIHAAGPYFCENVRIQSKVVATNVPPHGAFRGFGAPQSIFAMERHMDQVARALKLPPAEFRKRNFIQTGQSTATAQTILENPDYERLLKKAFELSDYDKKQQIYGEQNKFSKIKKGIGFATFMHGAGFTGSGERTLSSIIGLEATKDGRIRVLAASTEIGQGTNTIFSQIAADALCLNYEDIEIAQPDTRDVPNSGPTVASRTCMIVGGLIESAAVGIKQTLEKSGFLSNTYTPQEFKKACQEYQDKMGPLKVFSQYKQPPNVYWDDAKYVGEAYAAFAWAVYVAEVSIDLKTYETKVENFVAVQEVGKVIHPILAAGQIEGGVAQGIGFALFEKLRWDKGRLLNNQMTNYIMPTAKDVPPIHVHFEEINQIHGPHGAKGIGELPLDGPAPAILNAIENALGIPVNSIPLLPEDLMQAVESFNAR